MVLSVSSWSGKGKDSLHPARDKDRHTMYESRVLKAWPLLQWPLLLTLSHWELKFHFNSKILNSKSLQRCIFTNRTLTYVCISIAFKRIMPTTVYIPTIHLSTICLPSIYLRSSIYHPSIYNLSTYLPSIHLSTIYLLPTIYLPTIYLSTIHPSIYVPSIYLPSTYLLNLYST